MTPAKGISIKVLCLILCVSFLASCHTNNNVVSAKRKYRKGWFFNKSGDVNTNGSIRKDSTVKQVYTESKKANAVAPPEKVQGPDKKQLRQERRDSLRAIAKAKKAEKKKEKAEAKKNKLKAPPEPPDHITMELLVIIMVLTALSILITGLITPIVIWGIAQNFLLAVGVVFTFIAYLLSVNTSQGINIGANTDKPYNLGKPAWVLSLIACAPLGFLYACVKTSIISDAFMVHIATIGMFAGWACVALSLVLALKALFVNDRHKGKAVLALVIDALLITAAAILLY